MEERERESQHKLQDNVLIANPIPSNIMLKSAYNYYNLSEESYLKETANEILTYIYQYDQSEWDNIEIEAKLGYLDFKGSHIACFREIKDTFKVPALDRTSKYYQQYKYDFTAGLKEYQFYSLWYFISKESQIKGGDITALQPVNYKETHYASGVRRSIEYVNGCEVREELVHKKDKKHINIRNNGNDFRVTSCVEEKPREIQIDDVPVSYREKFRASYKFRFFRLDFTIVSSFKDLDSITPKSITYEVEFEFSELKMCLIHNKPEDVHKILIRFLQNIFCFYQAISPEFYVNRFPRPRYQNDSLYGDYMEKNLGIEKIIN